MHYGPTLLALLALSACSPTAPPADAGPDAVSADVQDASAASDAADAPDAPADASIVGVTTRTFVDTTRGTPANRDAGALPTRTLLTEIWYPALGVNSGAPETRDAHVDASSAHPLALLVHGSSGSRRNSTFLAQALAAAGYVVAAADFPLTAITTQGGPSDLHVDDQLGDLSFLADRLAAVSADATDALAGAIDAHAYAVIGHSTGGTIALLAAEAPDVHDPRVQSVVALAPCACFFTPTLFHTRALPLLIMAGTDDRFVPVMNNGARAYSLAGPPRLFTTLVGGTHLYFTDLRVSDDALSPMPTTAHDDIAIALARYGGGTACDTVPPRGDDPLMAFDAQHRHTVEWVRAFLDATVRAQTSALMHLEATSDPEVRVASDGI